MAKIKRIYAREILNSKANPTVEVTVVLENGFVGIASAPTGTSVGKYEALDLRDKDLARFNGLGVLKAVENVEKLISPKLSGMDASNLQTIDRAIIDLDGSMEKKKLGANATLPVSMAVAKAGALSQGVTLYTFLKNFIPGNYPLKVPTPCLNVLNGGLHAGGNLDFQEFLIIPASSKTYSESISMAVAIYNSLRKNLELKGIGTLVGDEGGFGPVFPTNKDALSLLKDSIETSKYRFNYDVFLGIDAASGNFSMEGKYRIKDREGGMSSDELLTYYGDLIQTYHLLYLEDPFSEDDWGGWEKIDKSGYTLIVGDDLTATNPIRLQNAISKKAITGIIIKPNQIGTVLESIAVLEMAKLAGIKIIVSHRSGETNDDFIADFAVAAGADYVKFGAPARGERVAKYNRLLQIDKQLRVF